LQKIEKALLRGCEKEYASLTGSATSGLYLALQALGLRNARVGIPNNVCINVPLAVYFSENVPVFLDIDPDTFVLSPESLKTSSELAALVFVHSYGTVVDIRVIREECRRRNVFLIEDCAVAQGARLPSGAPVGSMSDLAVFSFGAGKILDAAHGGACLTNDRGLFQEILRLNSGLPAFTRVADEAVSALSGEHTALYNLYHGKNPPEVIERFATRAKASAPFFLNRFDESYRPKIESGLEDLPANIERRRFRAGRLKRRLDQGNFPGLSSIRPPEGSVYWRFNVLIREGRNELLRQLLDKRFKVSSWYPSVDHFFTSRDSGRNSPESDRIGDQILNFWVNDEVTDSYFDEVYDAISIFFETKFAKKA